MEPGGQGARWAGRAQAIQLGALLLFAILIINLSLFQVFVVPNQNAEIEFKHSEEVRSDMVGARNAVLDAATGDQSFVEVDLAPAYPSRSLFVNPAAPSGTVRTTEAQSIVIRNDTAAAGGGTDISSGACPGTPETRALEYRAGYNYYDNAPTYRVENTVLFREFPGETLPGSGQQLVTEDTINLLPLQNDFSESGTGTATVEPVPGGVLSTRVVDPEIKLPTAYGPSAWERALEGSVPRSDFSVSGGTLTLDLSGTYVLNCGPIGMNGAPPSGARTGGLLGSGGGSGGTAGINPASLNEVKLTDVRLDGNDRVVATFRNKDSNPKTMIRGRIPFFFSGRGGTEPESGVLEGNPDDTLRIGAPSERIDETIEIPAGGTSEVSFDFGQNVGNDFYVFSVVYSDGTSGDYYVDIPNSGGGTDGGTVTADASDSVDAVDEGSTGTLDGGASTTSTGNIETYEWSLPGNPSNIQINDADTSTAEAEFDASGADVSSDTDVTVELTVTNKQGDTDTTTTTVTVRDTDTGPTESSPDINSFSASATGNSGKIDVSWDVSDADGDLDNIRVEITDSNGNQDASGDFTPSSGSSDTRTGNDAETFSVDKGDDYTVKLIVSDSNSGTSDTTDSQTVTIG